MSIGQILPLWTSSQHLRERLKTLQQMSHPHVHCISIEEDTKPTYINARQLRSRPTLPRSLAPPRAKAAAESPHLTPRSKRPVAIQTTADIHLLASCTEPAFKSPALPLATLSCETTSQHGIDGLTFENQTAPTFNDALPTVGLCTRDLHRTGS